LNSRYLKAMWRDFVKHIVPPILIILLFIIIGFLITHFTGIRKLGEGKAMWLCDLVLGPLMAAMACSILGGIGYAINEYWKGLKERVDEGLQRVDGNPQSRPSRNTRDRGNTSFEF
jgi:hypothetical protein